MTHNETVILWNLNLDSLMELGCSWVRDYLRNNPNVSDMISGNIPIVPSASSLRLYKLDAAPLRLIILWLIRRTSYESDRRLCDDSKK